MGRWYSTDRPPPDLYNASMDPDRIGPFWVEEVLGHGGAGVVYRATDTRNGRRVALKLVPPELADRRRLLRLRREAEALRRIDHPAIARLLGVETVDGRILLALEHIPGEDLRSRLGSGPLRPLEVLRVAAALDHAATGSQPWSSSSLAATSDTAASPALASPVPPSATPAITSSPLRSASGALSFPRWSMSRE